MQIKIALLAKISVIYTKYTLKMKDISTFLIPQKGGIKKKAPFWRPI